MKTLIGGNSHTGALKKGLEEAGAQNEIDVFVFGSAVVELAPFSAIENGRVVFTEEEYARNLRRLAGFGDFDPSIRWGLCMGTHNARLYRDRFWREAEPSAIARAGRRPVTLGLMQAMIEQDQKYTRRFITQLKSARAAVFVVSCPPPRRDHAAIDAGTRPEVVQTIDAEARRHFRQWLGDHEVDFVDYPPETADADGFLKLHFAAGVKENGRLDPHHANEAYGRLMIGAVDRYLSSLR